MKKVLVEKDLEEIIKKLEKEKTSIIELLEISEDTITRLKAEKNKLIHYVGVQECKDYKQVCKEFNIKPE